ncbi:hypothetical protein CHL67_09610 [Prosthecochloris sp. GSB1]|uniref:LptE family protein n=1 Tax=Prosthecochloris sp. GSB1 TaxID=281093 RepID=UPI000B8CAE5D|nr:LptE family protein [Prosthecochloris sp. GSB1]ASQ91139.1 hypothetical protein CHL67_09610 [Prosthecochloris sp. GSB1]
MIHRTHFACLTLLLLGLLLQGCYSFTGASLPPHINSIAVPLFEDRSGAGVAQLTAEFTEKLIEKFEAQSSLNIESAPGRADALVEAVITSFSDEPSQLGSDTERAVTNRITIVVRATCTDLVQNRPFFTRAPFSGFADYDVGDFEAKQQAIDSSIDQITDDLFNRIISNW